MSFLGKSFGSVDELLAAVKAEISEVDTDGVKTFAIENDGEIQSKLSNEIKQSQNYRKRAQEAEAKLSEIEQEKARLAAENEELNKLNPEKLRDTIQGLVKELGTVKADKAALEQQFEPLKTKVSDYEKRDIVNRIEKELVDTATELGVRPEAMRDIRLRASQFIVNDLGLVTTSDGTMVKDYLKTELNESPHWLPTSVGGGSNPGGISGNLDNKALFEQAKKSGNIGDMLKYAPTLGESEE